MGSTPKCRRSLGEGNGKPLQYSCLENPINRGAWWGTVNRVARSRTQLSDWACTHAHTHIHKFSVNGHMFPVFRLIGYLEETLIMLKDSSHKDYPYGVWIMMKDGFKVKNLVWCLKQVTVEIRIKKMGEITLSCWDAPSRKCSTY